MLEKFKGTTPPQESKEIKEKIDFDNIQKGMPIRIKQPEGKVYDTGADADVGQGGMNLEERWVETTISEINQNPDDQFITTEESIRQGSYFVNEFGPEQMWYENGILHADPTIDD